ncbi:cyclin-SDS [Arachis ipaensis]|uniref:cyclin-SDS n=1 Tax=Arachis ipaensis TaxID=130454 RepID=UPI000A2B5432|nr:cyclin-SDS [Arachis ipaensis]
MTTTLRRSKRKHNLEPAPKITGKKLRSNLPRRRRCQISPVVIVSTRFNASRENPCFSGKSMDSDSCSDDFAGGEASCNSSRASAVFAGNGGCSKSSEKLQCEISRNRRFGKQNESEVSESSCVDSNDRVRERSRSLILKFRSEKERRNDEFSEACTKSEITCEDAKSGNRNLKASSETKNNHDVVSFICKINRESELEFSQGSRNHREDDSNCVDLIAKSKINQSTNSSDLNCTEQLRFSYSNEDEDDEDDESEYYSSQGTVLSDLRSEMFSFPECSELELSDYTPSLFIDSGSQFSQGSVGETPSPTHSLFLQFRNEFTTLIITSPFNNNSSSVKDEVVPIHSKFVKFDDLDEEESYLMLRERERKQVLLWNYTDSYFSTTEFGDLVIQQRSQMVHWIVEVSFFFLTKKFSINGQQSYRKQLRQETMFLGVSLLDRFLSKGYFKVKRNLQIVGIACLTLATRIEENQQYSRVEQKNFYIGSNVYSRCEVVAMEWVVQEVLKFQCFIPTIYNFLWFYLKAAKVNAAVERRVKSLAVLVLSAEEQLCYWPSTVAAAIVILACLEVDQNAFHRVIGMHVRSKDENLHECMQSLQWLIRYL